MQKILITGCSGFIGRHLAEKLARTGYKIVGLDKNIPEKPIKNKRFRLIKEDITAGKNLEKIMQAVDGIVHLAAISRVSTCLNNPSSCLKINIRGTANVLEAAKKSKRNIWVILASTTELCRHHAATNLYASTKLISELLTRKYAEDYGRRSLVIRLATVFGSNRDINEKVMPTLIRQALKNKDIYLKDNSTLFDFIHVDDITKGIEKAIKYLEKKKAPHYDNLTLSSGRSVDLKTLAKLIVKQTGSTSSILMKPEPRVKLMKKTRLDTKKAKHLLNFKAGIGLEEGIRKTSKLYRKNKLK
ncbi:MAG: NAD(P)-dependent oxidoreductase [Candidatus Omnitrophica bacterium]|nr:NAD(P)-dependent oxidoreductase [Candidatus Omnitrophota bacterium]